MTAKRALLERLLSIPVAKWLKGEACEARAGLAGPTWTRGDSSTSARFTFTDHSGEVFPTAAAVAHQWMTDLRQAAKPTIPASVEQNVFRCLRPPREPRTVLAYDPVALSDGAMKVALRTGVLVLRQATEARGTRVLLYVPMTSTRFPALPSEKRPGLRMDLAVRGLAWQDYAAQDALLNDDPPAASCELCVAQVLLRQTSRVRSGLSHRHRAQELRGHAVALREYLETTVADVLDTFEAGELFRTHLAADPAAQSSDAASQMAFEGVVARLYLYFWAAQLAVAPKLYLLVIPLPGATIAPLLTLHRQLFPEPVQVIY